jgi:HD-GYP domain-containing protein (c-di-GMP phosphodiesterase class II)
MPSTIAAVNDGQIFRFLSKPCPPDALVGAVEAAIATHRLITRERVLLEETLHGSIRALTEVMSLTKPALFGRASRIAQHVSRLAAQLELPNCWEIEVAALLAPLGSIILPDETAARLQLGELPSEAEQAMQARIPAVTEQLLGNIPRLEGVRAILGAVGRSFRAAGTEIPVGARLLRIAEDFDIAETRLGSGELAIQAMRGKPDYDPALLDAFAQLLGALEQRQQVREVHTTELRPGMVLASDVLLQSGVVLAPRGFEVTPSFLERILNFPRGAVRAPLRVVIAAH